MAETPLTDSIEALTTYANQVTGASDTNLSDAVYTLAQGYGGGGGTSNMSDLLKARFEEQGYVFTDFAVNSVWGGYANIPHTLRRVPTDVIVFKKEFVYEANATGYQIGFLGDSNYGNDNDYNRTYLIQNALTNITNITFFDILTISPCIPLCSVRTLWKFCNGATSTTVSLRNDAGNASTKMLSGDWWLGVK